MKNGILYLLRENRGDAKKRQTKEGENEIEETTRGG